MNAQNVLRRSTFALLALLAMTGAAFAQPAAPTASAVVDGSYTVSYTPYCEAYLPPQFYCEYAYLLEQIGPDGQWNYVSSDTGSIAFSSRPPGSYSYMLWVAVSSPFYGSFYEASSPVTTVTIGSSATAPPAAPVRDNILDQLGYTYEVRRGDFNWDNRTDLFIRKVAGGVPRNGTVEQLILRQDSVINGNFSPVVPTPDQAAMASAWTPAPTIETRLHDIDVDGYVDLALMNLASVVPGAADRIVYSPGQPGQTEPGGMRHVDARFASFIADSMDYMYDPDYFIKNAPLYYYEIWVWYYYCPLYGVVHHPFCNLV